MRDWAAFEARCRDLGTDRRGDRTADLTNELGRAGLALPECRFPPLGEAVAGNRRGGGPTGPVRRWSSYDSALDEIAHLLTCRMSRPDPALFPMSGAGSALLSAMGSAPRCGCDLRPPAEPRRARPRAQATSAGSTAAVCWPWNEVCGTPSTQQQGPEGRKWPPKMFLTCSRIHYYRGASSETGPPYVTAV